MKAVVPNQPGWFREVEGFQRPDWDAFRRWIESNVSRDGWHDAWSAAATVWLNLLQVKLGSLYHVAESKNFLVLSPFDETKTDGVLKGLEQFLFRILKTLEGIAANSGFGKHVVLIFQTADEYYRYVSFFYKNEGEYAGSSGMFLRTDGYQHIAVHSLQEGALLPVLAHELIHNCLAHLSPPNWLNEGVTETLAEDMVRRQRHVLVDRELFNRHEAFWNEDNIQEFWTGQSFFRTGDSQQLSYNLAVVLVHKIYVDLELPKEDIRSFILNAKRGDAGEAAALMHLDNRLGDLVASFLGGGDWAPHPDRWPKSTG